MVVLDVKKIVHSEGGGEGKGKLGEADLSPEIESSCVTVAVKNDSGVVLDSLRTSSDVSTEAKSRKQKSHNTSSSNFIVQYFKKQSQSWSRRQFLTIFILACVEFLAAAVVSIQAPFYPEVARNKGASASENGLVFGIFEFTVFIMSPIYGAKMSYLGPNRVFNWGILVTGICCIIFGLLDQIEGRSAFILTCLVVRIIEAMGDAAFDTASFCLISMEFLECGRIARAFAILEVSYGLGLILGPTAGGALYEFGGYSLPFLTLGTMLFLSSFAVFLFFPKPIKNKGHPIASSSNESMQEPESTESTVPVNRGFKMFSMLKMPVIAMTSYSIVASTAGVGFISANLDHHLEQFQLNKFATGAVYGLVLGGTYSVLAPIWGWVADNTDKQKLITFTGTLLMIAGFILIGPIPYFPFDTTLPMICTGLAFFGAGLAANLVSAFLQLLKDAIANGYPDDISTYGGVSGLWTSMAALGYFIGPSAGGAQVDFLGFRWSSVFIIGGQVILLILLCAYYMGKEYGKRKKIVISPPSSDGDLAAQRNEEDVKNHNEIIGKRSAIVAKIPTVNNIDSENRDYDNS